MGDDGGDDARNGGGDGSWMTYSELAACRGFGRAAAVRLTQRQRLRRQPGNDGLIRVWVPADLARPARRSRQNGGGDDAPDDARDDGGGNRLLADALATFREAIASLTARAEEAEARASAERARADEAEADRDMAIATQNRAMIEVAAMRRAEALRRAAGLRQRLRAAWRGD
jgi:hypothetical protein